MAQLHEIFQGQVFAIVGIPLMMKSRLGYQCGNKIESVWCLYINNIIHVDTGLAQELLTYFYTADDGSQSQGLCSLYYSIV